MEDEDSMKGGALKREAEHHAVNIKTVKWDNLSDLNNSNAIDGDSNLGSDFGSLAGDKQGNLLDAIKGANANQNSFKEIDDEFEMAPEVRMGRDGQERKGMAQDKLRQGVSTGFNFKEILASGEPCSDDEDLNSRDSNPLEDEVPAYAAKSELSRGWQLGRGRQTIAANVERVVDLIIRREALLLIDQNKHLAKKRSAFQDAGDLDEIVDLEDFDGDGQDFFLGAPKPKQAVGPVSAPLRGAP